MADYVQSVADVTTSYTDLAKTESDARQRWFEVALVLLIACGGSLANALYLLKNGPYAELGASALRWSYGLIHQTSCLLLLGYVLSRRKLQFKDLGFRWSIRDAGVGILLTPVFVVAYAVGSFLVQLIHHGIFGDWATGHSGREFFAHPSVMFIPFAFLNPFFEELIVRAYLMTEVFALTRSSLLAVIVSVLVQSSYHLYYGWSGAISVSFLFLAFSVYYVRSRRALPIVVAHGIFDLIALIRLW